MRRSRAVLVLTFLLMILTSPTARAGDGDTWANTPGDGAGSIMDSGSGTVSKCDPFAKHPTCSIYETYGYGFIEWKAAPDDPSFLEKLAKHGVLGLGGAAVAGAGDVASATNPKSWGYGAINAVNTMGLMVLSMLIGLTALLLRLAYHPTWLNLLEPFQRIGQEVFGRELFMSLEWLTLCCAGIWLMGMARKARFKEVASEGSWVGLTVLLAVVAIVWPFTIAPAVDHAMTTGLSTINAQAAGFDNTDSPTATDGATGTLHKALGYEVWCSGLVGRDAGRKIADEYCPRLLKASAFSYYEMEKTEKDADARAQLSDQKYEDYKDAVSDLCDDSPTACAHVVGDKPWPRFGTVVLGFIGAISALPFVDISAGLLAYCLVLIRVALAVLPLLVLIGGFPPAKSVVIKLGEIVLVAFKVAIIMGFGATGLVVAIGGLMSPVAEANVIVSYIVVLLLTAGFWKVFKPHRRVAEALGRIPKGVRDKMKWNPLPTNGPDGSPEPDGVPTSGTNRYESKRPVEADQPSTAKAARKGATMTAIAGVATGGTVTVAGMAAGAAKSAAANKMSMPAEASMGRPKTTHTPRPNPRVYVPENVGSESSEGMRVLHPSSVEVVSSKTNKPPRGVRNDKPVYRGKMAQPHPENG